MRIKSLQQLLLLSFSLVMIPVLILLWRNLEALNFMGSNTSKDTRFAIQLSHLMEQTEDRALSLERVARQFVVLQEFQLRELLARNQKEFVQSAQQVCSMLEKPDMCHGDLPVLHLEHPLSTEALEHGSLKMDVFLARLRQTVSGQLESRLKDQQDYIASIKEQQLWFTFGLISLSFVAAGWSGRQILSPVRKLRSMITQLSENQHQLSAVSQYGPTEILQLEHRLHLLARRLNQLEQFRQTMLRHASHELKTPLASIKEGCSLLSEQLVGPLSAPQKEVVGLLMSSTQRLEHLTGQLLNYNNLLQQGKARYERVQCQRFFADIKQQHGLALSRHQHTLTLNIELEVMTTDPILLRRILDNLLSNAMAYGKVNSEIIISLYQEAEQYVMTCTNHDQSIEQARRQELFQPFNRGQQKRNDQIVGTGLGLSIVTECAGIFPVMLNA